MDDESTLKTESRSKPQHTPYSSEAEPLKTTLKPTSPNPTNTKFSSHNHSSSSKPTPVIEQRSLFSSPSTDESNLTNLKNRAMILLIFLFIIFLFYLLITGSFSSKKKAKVSISGLIEITEENGHSFTILDEYFRNSKHYTQGLVFFRNLLIESTGEYSHSNLHYLSINKYEKSVSVTNTTNLDSIEYGQGCDVVAFPKSNSDKKPQSFIYQLTWRNKKILRYDLTQPSPKTPTKIEFGDGQDLFGITHRPSPHPRFLVSFGTKEIQEIDLLSGNPILGRKWIIRHNNRISDDFGLGELEWIQDYLVAVNTKKRDQILVVDLSQEAIVKVVEFSSLLRSCNQYDMKKGWPPMSEEKHLSAIAYDGEKGEVYLTGRYWPFLYRLKFEEGFFKLK